MARRDGIDKPRGTATAEVASAFADAVLSPYQLHVQGAGAGSDLGAIITAMSPLVVAGKIREGAQGAVELHSVRLSPATRQAMGDWLEHHCDRVLTRHASWQSLAERSRSQAVSVLKAGFSSDEVQVGMAAGALVFGPLGAAVGGAVGGWLAKRREDTRLVEDLQVYLAGLDGWYNELVQDLESRVAPLVRRDRARARQRVLLLTLVAVLAVASICALMLLRG